MDKKLWYDDLFLFLGIFMEVNPKDGNICQSKRKYIQDAV